MLRPSPLQPCRRAYPCSPPFTALRNARPCRIHPAGPAGTALLAWPGCPPLTDCGSFKNRLRKRFKPLLSGPFDGLTRSALAMLLAGTPGATLGVPGGRNRRLRVLLGSGSERQCRRGRPVLPEEPAYVSERDLDLLGVRLPRV